MFQFFIPRETELPARAARSKKVRYAEEEFLNELDNLTDMEEEEDSDDEDAPLRRRSRGKKRRKSKTDRGSKRRRRLESLNCVT